MPHSYRCDGLVVHRAAPGPGETTSLGPTTVTTPARTAFDLARRAPTLTERVAAVDALAHHCAVDPEEVRVLRNRHPGPRHGGRVAPVLALVNPHAESPMESRMRMAMHLGGLPAPAVQHPVVALAASATTWILPTPRYGSPSSTTAPTTAHSGRRAPRPAPGGGATALGWYVLRFDANVVLFRPDRIADVVRVELAARGAA